MARFTDQFTRVNPRTFQPGINVPTWPGLVQQDACELLEGLTDDEVINLALVIEDEIECYADPTNFPTNPDSWLWTRVSRPGWSTSRTLESSASIRNAFCDLNILLAILEKRTVFAWRRVPRGVERWHLLAVHALWKLVDAQDVLFGLSPPTIGGCISSKGDIRSVDAAGLGMEAQAAISTALQRKERAHHAAEIERYRDQLERKKRSKKGTDTVVARHKKDDEVRLAAFAMADSYKGESRPKIAEHISNNLMLSSGGYVSYKTAYGWLLDRSHWEKKIAARSLKSRPTK